MTAASPPIVAFIGTGMMGQLAHLANYARLRDEGECQIAGVTDLKPRLAAAVADRYRVPRVYPSAGALLADPGIDGVVCVQQWPNNYPLVKQALTAGKSVITEKPMVGRLDEAEELVALATERGVHYAVGFMKRYDPGVERAREILADALASNRLGPLRHVDAVCHGGNWLHNVEPAIQTTELVAVPPPQSSYPDGCRTPAQRAAYDWLLNIFSHNVNLCHDLLGAEMAPCGAVFHGDRALSATLHCGDVLVSLRGASSRTHEWREWTTLTFERGEIRIKTPTPMNRQRTAQVWVLRPSGSGFATIQEHVPVDWAFFRQAQGFVRALDGQGPPRASAETALWDVRVMERLIELAEVI